MAGNTGAVAACGAAPAPPPDEEHPAAGCVTDAQLIPLDSADEVDRIEGDRAQELSQWILDGLNRSRVERAARTPLELSRNRSGPRRAVDPSHCRALRSFSGGGGDQHAANGIAKGAQLLECAVISSDLCETRTLANEPLRQITCGREHVDFVAVANDHHCVGKVDRWPFAEPAKDRTTAARRTEALLYHFALA